MCWLGIPQLKLNLYSSKYLFQNEINFQLYDVTLKNNADLPNLKKDQTALYTRMLSDNSESELAVALQKYYIGTNLQDVT